MTYIYFSLKVLLFLIAVLFLSVYLGKKKSGFAKDIINTCLFLIEAVVITTGLSVLFGFSKEEASFSIMIRNYVFCFTFYRISLFFTFKMFDSLRIDSYTAFKTKVESYLIYVELEKAIPLEDLNKDSLKITDSENQFTKEDRKNLLEIIELMKLYNPQTDSNTELKFILKQVIRTLDHNIKELGFEWRNSLILRILKN
ncbi:hypothetical protein [Bacillus atrophaeus]|uniref:hypothetical protein n=1 Tax=Bacillus atrophaeus TaxID=1452 RepID=UPI002E22E6B4|nr:hypothetical protein [Bacillus atrophaeus]